MMKPTRYLAAFAVAALVSACAVVPQYPTRAVRVIEPFGPGSGVDLVTRSLTPTLAAVWGQPVAVENLAGAGGTAAPAMVAKATPDGYTLLVSSSSHAYSAVLLQNLAYDPLKDFIPIAPLASQPYVLVAGTALGVKSVSDLVAKAKTGELKFGSAGLGTATHLGAEKFNLDAGIKATHVPMTVAQATTDTVAGRLAYWMSPIAIALPHIREGRLVALGVSGARRSPSLPEVPTLAEAGVAGFDFTIWFGIWAPAGTPPSIVEKLASDIARTVATQEVREQLAKNGAEPLSMPQAEFARFVAAQSASAERIVRAAGIKLR